MQILSKPQVNIQKAAERRTEIDEGLKLARRVDSLRSQYADEESKLYKFRDEATRIILSEIEIQTQKVNSLKELGALLEARNAELLKPLDQEWELLKQERAKFNEQKEIVDAQREANTQESENLRQRRAELDESEKRTAQRLSEATEARDEAVRVRESHEADYSAFTSIRHLAEQSFAEKVKKVSQREADVAIREEAVELLTKKAREKEHELLLRERALTIKENATNRPKP